MDINLKDKLKNLRQQKNVTQEALAKHLGISQQSVCKWERGEGFPDISLAIDLDYCTKVEPSCAILLHIICKTRDSSRSSPA